MPGEHLGYSDFYERALQLQIAAKQIDTRLDGTDEGLRRHKAAVWLKNKLMKESEKLYAEGGRRQHRNGHKG